VKPTHMMIIATTQSGKTVYANERHQKWPRFSIFVDTKGIDPIWGARTSTLVPLGAVRCKGPKVVYDPPRTTTSIDWTRAREHFVGFWGKVQEMARQNRWSSDQPPWIEFIVDEAQVWEQDDVIAEVLSDMAARGLGMGLVLVYISQHPKALSTVTRNNLDTRVVLRLGDEGRRCISSWGWPEPAITAWTVHPYHFCTSDPRNGWRLHCPIPVRGTKARCALHPNGPPAFADWERQVALERRLRERGEPAATAAGST
jgi:hypothetical protein